MCKKHFLSRFSDTSLFDAPRSVILTAITGTVTTHHWPASEVLDLKAASCQKTDPRFTMTIPTGRYVIQNVRSKNQLQLPDPNDGSRVQATSQDTTGTGPLKVGHYYVLSPYSLRLTAKLGNGKYTIQNQTHASYACCGPRAPLGGEVVVHHSRDEDQRPLRLYWGLPDDALETPVGLASTFTDTRNHWQFISA
ncbi:predicted protein [Postia placenta Mad-698-R]|uniref:Uncharacterized protein n=1 Tax=Postia placenta MAD-698-R-SB12 TaxID=670580 RepID=A0A1X6MLR4_9APHY|nr:hypothetical protein POSPLADRAFT_1157348 [Postia placenta MAD-698-R-SB12]EED77919.1 predicted protein [Postia placenta Mad-698-R]OSX57305.1 hypothetical protein POSPLADRAFT_1157348 [Postia placenta MAD-698-R-SB12]